MPRLPSGRLSRTAPSSASSARVSIAVSSRFIVPRRLLSDPFSDGGVTGFGVHISFVRSITMDKWSDDQLKKMTLGGNEAFKTFMESYGSEGGYSKGIGMNEKYNSWAAAQYREKLAAACADPPTDWAKSSPPANFGAPSRPDSGQATRKSRALGGSSLGSNTPSRTNSPYQDDVPSKVGNEAYFERLGSANASRPDHLPPSQGGKYGGFGSAPSPDPASSHPSYNLSSHAAPTLDEFQRNPLGALSKGWGLFSSAVTSAAGEINQTVVKPGMSRAQEMYDTGASDDWKRYVSTATTQAKTAGGWAAARAADGWGQVNDVARTKGGVDLNEQFGKLGLGKGSARDQGYGQVGQHGDDFFDEWDDHGAHASGSAASPNVATPAPARSSSSTPAPAKPVKKDNWDEDEWKDF